MGDINLKSIPEEEDKDNFEVHSIDDTERPSDVISAEPGTQIKINFGKFVELVAKHSFIDIIEKNQEKEIIIDANLLADLANSHEDAEEEYPKWVLVVVGLFLGAIVMYVILK